MIEKYISSFSEYKTNIKMDDRIRRLVFESDGRNYYVYRISNIKTNKHYYGSRVTKLEPKNDIGFKYFSSSSDETFKMDQKLNPMTYKYKIIRMFNNPGDQIIFESFLHQKFKVKKSNNFYNMSNQSPFGYSITSNKLIGKKISNGLNNIESNGLSVVVNSSKKSVITKSKVQDDGSTINDRTGKKISIIKNNIEANGLSVAVNSARRANITKSKVRADGLTINEHTGKKISISRRKIEANGLSVAVNASKKSIITCSYKENGELSIYEQATNKMLETRNKIKSNGMTSYVEGGKKISLSKRKIEYNGLSVAINAARKSVITKSKVQADGLTINEHVGKRQMGIGNPIFKGFYITSIGKYETAKSAGLDLNISESLIRLVCCKRCDWKITKTSYYMLEYLRKLGTLDQIVGKTWRSLGFTFEPYNI